MGSVIVFVLDIKRWCVLYRFFPALSQLRSGEQLHKGSERHGKEQYMIYIYEGEEVCSLF